MNIDILSKASVKLEKHVHFVPEAGCHIYNGTRKEKGYGVIKIGHKNYAAHRVAWEIANGEIPEGAIVLHKCDTPACCNPSHLRIGSNQQNIDDCVAKGRRFTKLTPSHVQHIWSSTESTVSLAAKFSVSRFAVSDARKGKTWNKCMRPEYER